MNSTYVVHEFLIISFEKNAIAYKIDILFMLGLQKCKDGAKERESFIGFLFKCLVAVSYFIQAIFQRYD